MNGSRKEDFKYKCPAGLHRHRSTESARKCHYCRRILADGFRRGSKRFFGEKQYQVPYDCHPVVTKLFEEMRTQKCTYKMMKERSGIDTHTLRAWRTRTIPTIDNLEACLNVLGLTLTTKKRVRD